ncbi:drug/metabolite transporter (DMT)-like permease [Kitasatospora sp. SolWspMP-SS2h]|uniref:DMT family transporter n=1 Tax=Kitasatospora sp. SolWspMP-SS2h TaxID=1305729 RepID=UPI000DB9ED42|nr:DMT family transporter [Kitasatospora sp. SolWspMP-SS2h]RAJ41764.1 drug/metabolite transporter (DMT)-like permease [Kitasatospora sp. SolWspMP-SS2h]
MSEKDSATALRPIAVGGTAQAALGVFAFSFSFPATAWALEGFGPWTVTGLRGILAGLLAGACLLATGARVPPRSAWPGLAAVAVGCAVGFPLLSTLALRLSSTAHSAVVIGLLPLATAAVGALRAGARPPRAFWTAALAGAAAVLAFTVQQSGGAGLTTADLYLFGALLVCAFGYAEGGRLARRMPGWQVIGWGVVAALPVTALTGALALTVEPARWNWHGVTGLAYLAAVSQFGGFVVWYRGMAAIGVPRASQLQLAQPLLTLCWAVLLLAETLPATAVPTALAVVACIAATQRAGRNRAGRRRAWRKGKAEGKTEKAAERVRAADGQAVRTQ